MLVSLVRSRLRLRHVGTLPLGLLVATSSSRRSRIKKQAAYFLGGFLASPFWVVDSLISIGTNNDPYPTNHNS